MTCGLLVQAKPFINEAHVFNDAGLSFDVWPPQTSSSAAQASDEVTPTDIKADFDTDTINSPVTAQNLASDSCAPDSLNGVGSCPAGMGSAHLNSISNNTVAVGGTSDVRPDKEISRGYLLAVKLWQEALATAAAAP